MFVRRKKNPSGVVSIQIIDKSKGRYEVVKTIGSSMDVPTIESLYLQGKQWISASIGEQDIFKTHNQSVEELQVTEYLLSNIENILLNGVQLLLNKVFNLTGFDAIQDDIFRQLAIARLSQPMSKAATVEYLKSHFDEDVQLHRIYRYLDKLYNTQQEKIQQISVEHTRRILGGKIGLLFYDVTTLYFESDYGDELRETGFSKDGKHSQPQVVLGLLTSKDGYPLSYSIFNDSQYEGRTMLPVVEDFVQRFNLDDFIIVADSGLMSQSNIDMLESSNYKYIIGARIKNETTEIKQWVLSRQKQDGVFNETHKGHARLIVGYCDKRQVQQRKRRKKA